MVYDSVSYQYPVDKNGRKTGHTICIVVKYNKAFVGTSLCSEKDQFCYAIGRHEALCRALVSLKSYEEKRGLE